MPNESTYTGSDAAQIWPTKYHPQSTWTPERIEILTSIWKAGGSASDCARALGVTRNAAIGKLHRMGLHRGAVTARNSFSTHTARASKRRAPRPDATKRAFVGASVAGPKAKPRPESAPIEAPDMRRVSFADLEPPHCRFPIGDPREPDFVFCGADRTHGAYCASHFRVVYQPEAIKKAERLAKRFLRRAA